MKPQIILLAHNIRSLWNIGSLFRTADCFAVEKLYLTGYTATPPRREISKTAIGAEEWIDWEYAEDPLEVIEKLQSEDWTIVALEKTDTSTNIENWKPQGNICLILGHEVTGVPKEQLMLCECVIHIPMLGKKSSLNVSNAAAVALHHMRSA